LRIRSRWNNRHGFGIDGTRVAGPVIWIAVLQLCFPTQDKKKK
jgi:hypothetical protein